MYLNLCKVIKFKYVYKQSKPVHISNCYSYNIQRNKLFIKLNKSYRITAAINQNSRLKSTLSSCKYEILSNCVAKKFISTKNQAMCAHATTDIFYFIKTHTEKMSENSGANSCDSQEVVFAKLSGITCTQNKRKLI